MTLNLRSITVALIQLATHCSTWHSPKSQRSRCIQYVLYHLIVHSKPISVVAMPPTRSSSWPRCHSRLVPASTSHPTTDVAANANAFLFLIEIAALSQHYLDLGGKLCACALPWKRRRRQYLLQGKFSGFSWDSYRSERKDSPPHLVLPTLICCVTTRSELC